MIYDAKNEENLSSELFKNPTSDFRGAPFWAWNCKLDIENLKEQIDCMREMGMGGAHMHVRTGMATTYLSDEHMSLIKGCIEKFKENNMIGWLYDEDRWPSGAAGGYVTKDPQYRARYLLMTPKSYEEDKSSHDTLISTAKAVRTGNGKLIACYDILLDDSGYIKSYRLIGKDDKPVGVKWYAYMETPNPNPWYNNQTYVNTLDKAAIDKFIEITYETYKKSIGDEFGKSVFSIFTDEPQFSHKTTLDYAHDLKDITLPWTDDIPETYRKAYNDEILEKLPEVIWNLKDNAPSVTRYRYHDHIAERFSEAFADNCGKWCRDNGLMLTGHMMEEPSLESQTAALGEAMRSYRSFQLPGVDMLCDSYEYTTVKQAASACHQFGCPGVISELYGVTNWDFDFRGHKTQGDWQAALGVTTRVPHLAWVSMEGEAKRDYPASINYQAPWHSKYSYVEDYFARVSTALTRGKADIRIGVIHPIESYWLHWGPGEHTRIIRNELDKKFNDFINWMLRGTIDFDYICESLLPIQCDKGGAPLKVGEMNYDVVIVPGCETLRSTTLERLEVFRKEGGKLIFMGKAPILENAVASQRGKNLYEQSDSIEYSKSELLSKLEPERSIEIRGTDGSLTENLVFQLRADGSRKWLFIANGVKPQNEDIAVPHSIKIKIKGEYTVIQYNALNGDIYGIPHKVKNGFTYIENEIYDHDSLLYCLEKEKETTREINITKKEYKTVKLPSKMEYILDEGNVFMLDRAEYSFDGGEYFPEEEILRADNLFRSKLGWPSRMDAVAQPWVVPDEPYEHEFSLRYKIESEIDYQKPVLAVENAENIKISFNGEAVSNTITGYYTDKSIKTVALPPIKKGINELIIKIPYNKRSGAENCFILGEFGVCLNGVNAKIVKKPEYVAFGNLVEQGFPFYGSNITYRADINTEKGDLKIHIPKYKGALITVFLDGEEKGDIVYSPYNIVIPCISEGSHRLDIKLWGSRVNTFGPLHLSNEKHLWIGPDAYRTQGDAWSNEYCLKKVGILKAPNVEMLK